jgi:hypothetical protein
MSLLNRRAWMSAAGCGAAALIVPAWASAQHASMIHPFLGAFRFVGGDEERNVWSASIDDVVAGMSVLTRGIARDRLKETNPIATTLAFLGNDKVLTSSFDARVYTGLFDGTEVMVTTTAGDKMKLELKLKQDELQQIFTGDEKGRTNTFRLSGDKMTKHVRVHASKLPKPLVYTLSYERA